MMHADAPIFTDLFTETRLIRSSRLIWLSWHPAGANVRSSVAISYGDENLTVWYYRSHIRAPFFFVACPPSLRTNVRSRVFIRSVIVKAKASFRRRSEGHWPLSLDRKNNSPANFPDTTFLRTTRQADWFGTQLDCFGVEEPDYGGL